MNFWLCLAISVITGGVMVLVPSPWINWIAAMLIGWIMASFIDPDTSPKWFK